jgi:hypothetical protein
MASSNPSQPEINHADWAKDQLKDEWRVSKSSLCTKHVVIDYLAVPGSTVEFPSLVEHLIVMSLTHQSRQVNANSTMKCNTQDLQK